MNVGQVFYLDTKDENVARDVAMYHLVNTKLYDFEVEEVPEDVEPESAGNDSK